MYVIYYWLNYNDISNSINTIHHSLELFWASYLRTWMDKTLNPFESINEHLKYVSRTLFDMGTNEQERYAKHSDRWIYQIKSERKYLLYLHAIWIKVSGQIQQLLIFNWRSMKVCGEYQHKRTFADSDLW